MTGLIFNDWLEKFNSKMKARNRKVLLLLDNAPSHITPENEDGNMPFSNVTVHFLPPATTSHLQPMDAGIIQNMKVHYRRLQIQYLVDNIDAGKPPHLLLSDAIKFAKAAWDAVTPATIQKCFRHTKILPPDWELTETAAENSDVRVNDQGLFERLAEAYNINLTTLMRLEEYADIEKEVPATAILEDEDILDMVREDDENNNQAETNPEDEDDKSEPEKPPSQHEARMALNLISKYLDAKDSTVESDIGLINRLRLRIDSYGLIQSSITEYFKPAQTNE
jgi:hypothetical protein